MPHIQKQTLLGQTPKELSVCTRKNNLSVERASERNGPSAKGILGASGGDKNFLEDFGDL